MPSLICPVGSQKDFFRLLSRIVPGLRSADYTILWHRITDLEFKTPIADNIAAAVDSIGLKTASSSGWMGEKHGVMRLRVD